jgi:predicted Holliday junction resolvase-like endonuclease
MNRFRTQLKENANSVLAIFSVLAGVGTTSAYVASLSSRNRELEEKLRASEKLSEEKIKASEEKINAFQKLSEEKIKASEEKINASEKLSEEKIKASEERTKKEVAHKLLEIFATAEYESAKDKVFDRVKHVLDNVNNKGK